ncbi:MAG TPA: LptA/OstA family protein [Chthoniobacterales bacterium]|nr:LptA/OstA family protein [Chthoniobacterales bacterium]
MARLSAQGVVVATGEAKKPDKTAAKAPTENTADKILGVDRNLKTNEPVTTEIYADEAFFDSNKYIGTFTGHVKVADPRFNLQSDKLTVYVRKGENQGMEKAIAEGNVGVVRDRADPNGGPVSRAVGRADTATYITATNNIELKGTPRVQQGPNLHVATSPDTVMIINETGQLTTHGPSRTDMHQEPKSDGAAKKAETPPKP